MLFTVTRKEGGMVSEYIRGGEDSFYIHYTAILGLRRHITFPFLPPSYSHFQMSTLKYKAAGGVLCINSYQWKRRFPPVTQSPLWEYHPSKHTYWGFPGCFPNSVPPQAPSSSAQKKTCGRQLIKPSSRSWPSSVVKESGITLPGWCRTVISAYLRRGQPLWRGLFMKIFRPLGPEVKGRCPVCWGQKRSNPELHQKWHLSWGKPVDDFSWTEFPDACRLPAWDQKDTVPREEILTVAIADMNRFGGKIPPLRPGRLLLLREKEIKGKW